MKNKLNRFLDDFPILVSGIAMTAMIVFSALNAICRYLFSFTFVWTDDICAICFAWAVFFGAAAVSRKNGHFGVEVMCKWLPPRAWQFMEIIISVISVAVIGCLSWLSWILTANTGTKILTATRISYKYFDAGMAIGFTLMLLYTVIILVQQIRAFFGKKEPEAPAQDA